MCLIMLSILTFIVATEDQKAVLQLQFEKYKNLKPKIYTIPVGNIKYLKFEQQKAIFCDYSFSFSK